jgi:two-component system, cell cycle sensor histidine kinase and response regulator CckA
LLLGVLLSAGGAVALRQLETRQWRSLFSLGTERRARAIQRQIDGDLSALNALRSFMEARYPLTASDFNDFARRLLESHHSLLAAEWVARVRSGKERQSFEEELRRDGLANAQITEGTPQVSRVAVDRPEYHPVRFIFPLGDANRSALGYDMGSCASCLKAFETAATTGQATTMGRLKILERNGFGVLVVLPAYRAGRTAGPTDYAMILLQVAGVVERALQYFNPEEGIDVTVQDESATDATRFLYYHPSHAVAGKLDFGQEPVVPAGSFQRTQALYVGNRSWKLIFTPTAAAIEASRTWWPWLTLLLGLVSTLAVAAHFRSEIAHGLMSRQFLQDLTDANAHLSREIETRKNAEGALRTSEAEYRLLFEGNNLPTWVCELPSLRILAANDAAVRHYGYTADQLKSLTLFDLGAPEDTDRLAERTRSGFSAKDQVLPWRHRKADGAPIMVEMTGNPIRFRGQNACLIMANDVTRRLKIEEQAHQSQRLETVGRLAGGIAHDFNNLLTVVNGYSDLILSEIGCENKFSVRLSQIRSAGQRAAELTQQLLAFSRGQIIQPKVLSLNDAVNEMSRMLRRVIGEDVDFRLNLSPECRNILADEGQISQILMNLAVNARDAMPEGGALVITTSPEYFEEGSKSLDADARPGDYVRLTVADTGSGIAPDVKARIFEPFFTTKGIGKGTGLGLSTVYGMVKQQGGWIAVDSELGLGAAFSIYWPATSDPVAERRSPAKQAVRGSESVLVVEDQDDVRKLAVSVLQRYGYTVYHAASPEGALAFAGSFLGPLDMLLTDVVMPHMSGPELAMKIRQINPNIRILFMSGYSNEASGLDTPDLGELPYLAKPFTAEALASSVRHTLDRACFSFTSPA